MALHADDGSDFAELELSSENIELDTDAAGEDEAPPIRLSAQDDAREKINKALRKHLPKKRGDEWNAIKRRKGPLTLLYLPVEVLELIVKEVTHTNDLTALALSNSALYTLAVPHIYARFDIVWPEGQTDNTESKSVDALTYGLSTLCLGSTFARTTQKLFNPGASVPSRFTRTNYAAYTKKFSLGNGPKEWVAEYMITKEGGKMLGTLVAIAISKMINLETFIWDMPTGVLSDIFMGLSSLEDQDNCRLERVWIRWHDNSEQPIAANDGTHPTGPLPASVPVGSILTPVGIHLPSGVNHPAPRPPIPFSQHQVEYPTFSVLPPLKSITVLEIDELSYLDELSMLIERSQPRLRILRVGIAAHAQMKDFMQTWDGPGLKQVDHRARWPGESTIGERRLGGVLGILVGRIYDIKKRSKGKDKAHPEVAGSSAAPTSASEQAGGDDSALIAANGGDGADINLASHAVAKQSFSKSKLHRSSNRRKRLEGKLKLETLELERISLSLHVCRHAIDWSILTSLTILDCPQHENLWKMLKKAFQPTPLMSGFGISVSNPPPPPAPGAPMQYHLALKHLHTDLTSPALVTFLKETLAPNSLEVLFLQDRRRHALPPVVTIDQIFKGPLKRHRGSLRKLLLDSATTRGTSSNNPTPAESQRWRSWVLNTKILLYITSGRMSNLKELSVALDNKDWHTFLQRLPNVPHLRSLHIPNLLGFSQTMDPKELALQITDIITLRPEIEICYVGLFNKCYEILEARNDETSSSNAGRSFFTDPIPAPATNATGHGGDSDADDGDEEETSDDEAMEAAAAAMDGDSDAEDGDVGAPNDPDEDQSDTETGADDDGDINDDTDTDDGFVEPNSGAGKLRLREILFYDDKVAVFKARHAQL